MTITRISFHGASHGCFLSYVSVVFDDCFVVTGIKLVRRHGGKRLLVCMPSRRKPDESHTDIAHPITMDFRRDLERRVFEAWTCHQKETAGAAGAG